MTVMTATVVAASVPLTVMVVVVARYVGIKSERAVKQRIGCGIAIPADSAVKLDTCHSKCHLCTTADPSANKCINTQRGKKSCKRSVTAAVGIDYFTVYDFSVFCGINLKLLGVTKVLKDLSVFVSYCNFH